MPLLLVCENYQTLGVLFVSWLLGSIHEQALSRITLSSPEYLGFRQLTESILWCKQLFSLIENVGSFIASVSVRTPAPPHPHS